VQQVARAARHRGGRRVQSTWPVAARGHRGSRRVRSTRSTHRLRGDFAPASRCGVQATPGRVAAAPRGAASAVAGRRRSAPPNAGGQRGRRRRRRGANGGVGGDGDAGHAAAPGGPRGAGRAAAAAAGRRAATRPCGGRWAPPRRAGGHRPDAADRRHELGCPARRDPRGPRVATSPCPANSSACRPALRVATPPLVHPRSGSGAATRPFGRSAAGGRSAALWATLRAAWQAPPAAPSAPALRAPPAAPPRAAPAAALWAPRKAPPAAAQKAAVGGAAPPHRQPPIVRPPVGPVCRRSRATRVGRAVCPPCPTEGRTRVRPLSLATSSCGPPTWASCAHGRAVTPLASRRTRARR
jgi:hypothetical protein